MRVAAQWHAEISPTNAGGLVLRAMRLRISGQVDGMTIVRPLADGDGGTSDAGEGGRWCGLKSRFGQPPEGSVGLVAGDKGLTALKIGQSPRYFLFPQATGDSQVSNTLPTYLMRPRNGARPTSKRTPPLASPSRVRSRVARVQQAELQKSVNFSSAPPLRHEILTSQGIRSTAVLSSHSSTACDLRAP